MNSHTEDRARFFQLIWHEPENDGFRDLFLPEVFSGPAPEEIYTYDVISPEERRFQSKCRIRKDGKTVELDYEVFKDFNESQGMDLGVLRLVFSDSDRTIISLGGVLWKEHSTNSFVEAKVDVCPPQISSRSPYRAPSRRGEPHGDADPDIEEILGSTIERAAGFQSNPQIRRAIEMYAMDRAETYLRTEGYEPQDKHKTKSYDFLCTADGAELYVEVKGMQDDGGSVALTPKEVKHAQEHKSSALFIVHSVKVKGKRTPVVSGGTDVFIKRWDISTGTLKPRGYVYSINRTVFEISTLRQE